ncbi:hypothetical protein GCM10029978_044600 [Actinoallomurus acanthiterrae]
MSERQDRPEGRHALPGDRPVAGMPSDDAVEGRVVGSSGERTGRPDDATAGSAAGATVPRQPGPVTDTSGPLPGRTGGTDRERDERTRSEGSRGVRPDAPGTADTDRSAGTGSDGMIEPGSAADPLGERTAGPTATVRSYAHGGRSAPTMAPDTGASPDRDEGGSPGGRSGASVTRTDLPGAGGPGEARTAGPGMEGPNATRTDGPGMGGPGEARAAGERLLGRGDADRFDSRWHEVKAGFVDDPRDSVRQASSLCEEAVRALTAALDEQRRSLERRWNGDDADTERLRVALRAYGDLLQRLVKL